MFLTAWNATHYQERMCTRQRLLQFPLTSADATSQTILMSLQGLGYTYMNSIGNVKKSILLNK